MAKPASADPTFHAMAHTLPEPTAAALPLVHRIAVLCYLYDHEGRLLLLHRLQAPNAGMHSPIGGKLESALGEGPHECAVREIHEETGVTVRSDEVRLIGIISERAYPSQDSKRAHWLLFLFEVMRPIGHDEITSYTFAEGTLEWIEIDQVETIGIPETDRRVMWPNVKALRGRREALGFFMAHIDCSTDPFTWRLEESWGADVGST